MSAPDSRIFVDLPAEEADAWLADLARRVAREEIASAFGMLLRRTQDRPVPGLAQLFGEALRDFSATETDPGD